MNNTCLTFIYPIILSSWSKAVKAFFYGLDDYKLSDILTGILNFSISLGLSACPM